MSQNKVYYKCPFCNDDDFDLIGLKHHLLHYCEIFQSLEEMLFL